MTPITPARGRTRRALIACTVALAFAPVAVQAQGSLGPATCGDLRPPGQYGPFDYRSVDSEIRHRVEDYHFTPDVESTKKGATGSSAGGDLDYTLRAFPNNPRALLAMSRYALRMKAERAPGLRFTAECYFERAIRFVPNDPMPRLLYASYLRDRKRTGDMKVQLEEAEKLRGDPSNFDFDFNLGMLYFDAGQYDKSLEAAKRAYALGAPLPALRNKLKAAGKWKEDPAPPAAPAAAAPKDPPPVVPTDETAPKDPARP